MPFTKAPIKREKLNTAGFSWMSETLKCFSHLDLFVLFAVSKYCSCSATDMLLCSLICINPSLDVSVPRQIQPKDICHIMFIMPLGPEKSLNMSVPIFRLLMNKTLSQLIYYPFTQTAPALISTRSSFNQLWLCSVYMNRRQPGFDNTSCASLSLCSCVKLGGKKALIYLIA